MTVNSNQTFNMDINLVAKLHNHATKKSQDENKRALEALNRFHDEHGCFSDEYRTF